MGKNDAVHASSTDLQPEHVDQLDQQESLTKHLNWQHAPQLALLATVFFLGPPDWTDVLPWLSGDDGNMGGGKPSH